MRAQTRNPFIDYARYFFAFLVVCIHVPLAHGGTLWMPLARCAVPFFYLVTGYYLGRSICNSQADSKMKIACNKWFHLWVKYIITFLIISLLLDIIFTQLERWTITDTQFLLINGIMPFIDEHTWDGKVYGISTLWFLYCGWLALCVLYALHKYIFSKWLLAVVIMLQIALAFAVYKEKTNWLFFYSSLPFLIYGIWIAKIQKEIHLLSKHIKCLALITFLIFLIGVIEMRINKDVVFTNIPLSICIFLLLTWGVDTSKRLQGIVLPPPISHIFTLDIYIWHRLVYYIMKIMGMEMHGFDAIAVFLITLALAVGIRRSFKYLSNLTIRQ